MKKNRAINAGGINGLGESLVNTNSASFKGLQEMIRQQSAKRSEADKMSDRLVSLRFQMETYLLQDIGGDPIPAGGFIEKLLKAAGVSKKKFAAYIDHDYANLIAVLKGRRKVNSELAIKAGEIFGINPEIWLHIEAKNELRNYLSHKPVDRHYSLKELVV